MGQIRYKVTLSREERTQLQEMSYPDGLPPERPVIGPGSTGVR